MKVFYWCPFFSEIATISAVINSAKSLLRYSKNNKYSVGIINAIGEWDEYQNLIDKNIFLKRLSKKNYIKKIPKGGFFKSRFSYIFIFFISFFRLLKLINSKKPGLPNNSFNNFIANFCIYFFQQKNKNNFKNFRSS